MSSGRKTATVVVAVVLLGTVLGVPWWLGWRGIHYWTVAAALGTVGAAIVAVVYVSLTHLLWREAARQREGELMLRLIDEYDNLRDDVRRVQTWFDAHVNQRRDPPEVFKNSPNFEALDSARFRVSRFFVRTRKLVAAKFLSESVVVAAVERRAIEEVFLRMVDPLDEVTAGEKYIRIDRDFYTRLLDRYEQEAKQ